MEEKKGTLKIKLTTVILLFILLMLVVIGIFFYCIRDNTINEANFKENKNSLGENSIVGSNTTLDVSEPNYSTSKMQELDIHSDLVQKLYRYILKYSDYEENLVYQSEKITLETMDNKLKLMTIFENLTSTDADEITNKNEYDIPITHTLFKKETVERKAQEIFGNSVTITHEECPIYFTKAIDYKNGMYDCYTYQGGGRTPWEFSVSQIKSAEQENDEIHLYDQYLHVYDEIAETTLEEGIYTASDKKTKISDLIDISIDSGLDKESYEKELFSTYKEKLGNKIQTFKHTFKKNSNGNYYWYSTEPVK